MDNEDKMNCLTLNFPNDLSLDLLFYIIGSAALLWTNFQQKRILKLENFILSLEKNNRTPQSVTVGGAPKRTLK